MHGHFLGLGFIISLLHFHAHTDHLETAMAAKKTKVSRNPDLIRGVGKFSRSKMYHKRGLWAIKAKNGGTFPRHEKKPAEEPKSAAVEKPAKFYPADDVKKPLANKRKAKPTKLRLSLLPFSVLLFKMD